MFSAHKTCRCILGCIAYIFNRRVDASQANLLKNAMPLKEFQSRLLVVRSQRVKRDFYIGKHQIKPSLI